MKKNYLFVLMAVGLLISGNVGAAKTNVADLQQLRDAFANGSGEIVLTNDIDIDLTKVEPLLVTTTDPITFDLNGHTISGSDVNTDRGMWEVSQAGLINIEPKADVTIIATGGGAVKVNENSKHLLALCSYGNLVIKGGDFYGTYGSAIMTKKEGADAPSKKIVIEGDASFDSKEGWTVSIEIPSQISGNVYAHSATAGALYVEKSFEIYGGTFISDTSEGVQTVGNGDVYGGIFISGSEIKNGIANYATIRVKGGTFPNTLTTITPHTGYAFFHNAEGTYVPQLDKTIDSYTVKHVIATLGETKYASVKEAIDAADGDEIVIANAMSEEEAEVLTISKSITISNDKTFKGQINVTNGAEVVLTGTGIYDGILSANGGTLYTFGGKYTSDPSAFVSAAQGCSCKKEGDYWVVSQVVAKIGGTPYSTLQAAISAAKDNEQIDMQVDANMPNSAIAVNKNLIINLNDKTLFATGTSSKLNINTAGKTVTIQNGTIAAKPAVKNLEALLEQSAANTLNLEGVKLQNEKGSYAIKVSKANTALNIDNACVVNVSKAAIYASADVKLTNNAQLGEVRLANVAATITNNAGASMTLNTSTDNSKAISLTNAGTITINSGYYLGTMALISGNQVTINGGWFAPAIIDADSKAYTLGANKTSVKKSYKGTEVYQIEESGQSYECSMNDYNYITLREALQANTSTESVEITLLRDCDVDVTADNFYNVKKTDKVVLNLNGKKLHATNNSLNSNINLFNVAGSLTIKDETNNGEITYVDEVGSHNTYVINIVDGGSVIINGGTIANLARKSALQWCIEASAGSSIEINGGKVYAPYCRAMRFFLNGASEASFTMNGGEINSSLGIWIQLPTAQSVVPHLNFTMVNGSMVLTNNEVANAVDVLSNYGQAFNELKFNVTGGYIGGAIYLGGGCNFDGLGSEQISLENGIFDAHNPLVSEYVNGKRDLPHNVITGGAYFFDYPNHTSDPNKYSQFCEYIMPGHYAFKMHQVKTAIEADTTIIANGVSYYFAEGEATDGSFWAVIDGKGEKQPVVIDESKELKQEDIDPNADLIVTGENTQVTIKLDNTVDVNRIEVGEGAGIIVENGAVLNVGTGGMAIDGQSTETTFVKVMPGGKVTTVGTISSTDVKEIVIMADPEIGSGTVLISPDVNFNNQPKSTIQMATKAHKEVVDDQDVYYWQHFGIPSIGNGDFKNPTAPKISINKDVDTYLNQWVNGKWTTMTSVSQMNVPFRGYNLTNTSTDGAIYTFEGYMVGNGDAPLHFYQLGYNVMGNSYTAPMYVEEMLKEVVAQFGTDVEATVWVYNSKNDNHIYVTKHDVESGDADFDAIASMQGFIMKLTQGSSAEGTINYETAVWNNPFQTAVPLQAPKANANAVKANIVVTSSVSNSVVKLRESNEFTSEFDNGIDASKLMDAHFNVFASTEAGELATVASNDLNGTFLSMNTTEEGEYTMTFEKVQNMDYHIIDMLTGYEVAIAEGNTYKFSAPANTKMENRFQVVASAKVPTALKNRTTANRTGIYSIMGQYVGDAAALMALPQGVYTVNGVKIVK